MASPEMIERVLAYVSKDIIVGDDGFHVWWPSDLKGFLTAHTLRVIADELDRLNEPWKAEIEKQMTLERYIENQLNVPAESVDIMHVRYEDKPHEA